MDTWSLEDLEDLEDNKRTTGTDLKTLNSGKLHIRESVLLSRRDAD